MRLNMSEQQADRVYGRLDAFWETGTEGVQWSFEDPSLPGYDSLFTITNKLLTILAYDNVTPLWQGIVDLEYKRNYLSYPQNPDFGQQAIFNHWVHGFEKTLSPELWATFFFEKRRAILHDPATHAFHGTCDQVLANITKMPQEASLALYKSSLYPWLIYYSDGSVHSIADNWGLDFAEILKLLGNVTEQRVIKLKTWPKSADDYIFVPFSIEMFERIALLWGINGGLIWWFDTIPERIRWLNRDTSTGETTRELLLNGGLSGLRRIHTSLCYARNAVSTHT